MITHEADIKAQRKGLLFIVASIDNQPFFIFTFTCVCSDWKNRTVTWATPLATHTPSLTSVSSVTCTLPDFLLCMCMYAGAGGQGRGDSLHRKLPSAACRPACEDSRSSFHIGTSSAHLVLFKCCSMCPCINLVTCLLMEILVIVFILCYLCFAVAVLQEHPCNFTFVRLRN